MLTFENIPLAIYINGNRNLVFTEYYTLRNTAQYFDVLLLLIVIKIQQEKYHQFINHTDEKTEVQKS